MKHAWPVLIALAIAWFSPDVFALQKKDIKTIERYISRQAKQEHGKVHKEARKFIAGDMNRDGVADVAVLYTIESQGGSDNYLQYLALFLRRHGKLVPLTHAEVGGKLVRSVEGGEVDNNSIHLDTLTYDEDDPACCPSIKGTTRYVIVGKSLREQE